MSWDNKVQKYQWNRFQNGVDLSSLGIHTGDTCRVRLSVLPGSGRVWLKSPEDSVDHLWYAPHGVYPQRLASLEAVHSSSYTTEWGKQLRTPEHFLCALFLFYPKLMEAKLDLRVYLDGPEFPILDGSAWPWWQAFHQLLNCPHSSLKAENLKSPKGLSLSVGFADKILKWDSNSSLPLRKLLQSPTFSSWVDYQIAKQKGFVKGGAPSNAIVYQGSTNRPRRLTWGTSHQSEVELAELFCLHKMVDFIGDLAILSMKPPKGNYEVVDGGHYQHHQILKGILNDIS